MTDEYADQVRAGRSRPIGAALEEIADPGHHVGGGTAAAIAGALAGATAALVARLSAGRKRNADRAVAIQDDLDRLADLQDQLLVAARVDEQSLDELMAYFRDRNTSDETMAKALQRAARSTLAIANAAAEVCEIAARQAPAASKFTISDLGAAAAIARGAATAALLTAETNISMLENYPIAADALESLRRDAQAADGRSAEAAELTLRLTRDRIDR